MKDMHVFLSSLLLTVGAATFPAAAQPSSPVAVQQVPSRASAQNVQSSPVGGTGSSSSAQERAAVPVVPPAIVEACRAAQAGDRPPPDGIDCMAAMQALAAASTPASAEGSLLEMFGMRSDFSATPAAPAVNAANADSAARQLATGDVQTGTGGGAAAIVARERGAPPPSAPPPGGPR